MPIIADAQVAIRGDLDGFRKDLASARTQTVTLGDDIRKALSFGPLAAQGPDALVAGLQRARSEADQVNASIRKLAASGDLPAAEARRYADLLDEIGIEADQTASELKQLRAADPAFNTPAIQAAGRELDRVGDEAKETAAQLNAMKGVRADTHLERLAQEARESSKALDQTGKSSGGLIQKLNSVKGALVGLGLFIGAQQIVSGLKTFFGDSIDAATNLQTATTGVTTVLGDASAEIIAFGETSADSFGLSKRAAAEYGAVLGAQLKAADFDLAAAARETVNLEQKAADLAATFGGDVGDAVTAISALLRGERDTIEKYGVSIKQVDVNARIASLGLDTSTAAALKNATAVASLSLFYEQSVDSVDAFSKNTDTNAVIQAKAAAKIENAMGRLGDALLPLVADVTEFSADVLPKLIDGLITVGEVVTPLAENAIPALAVAFGVTLVGAFKAAQVTGVESATAIKLAWGLALLGIPILLEHFRGQSQAVLESNADDVDKLTDMYNLFPDIVETALDRIPRVVKETGSRATAEQKAALLAGEKDIKDAAEKGITGPIWQAAYDAKQKAQQEAAGIPKAMGDAILQREKDLTDSVAILLTFLETALTPAQERAAAIAFLTSQAYADALASGKPAAIAKANELANAANVVLYGAIEDGTAAGTGLGEAWIAALNAALGTGVRRTAASVGAYSKMLQFTHSPPYAGATEAGLGVAEHWLGGVNKGLAAGNLNLPSLGSWAGGLPPMSPIASSMVGSGAGTTINNWTLSIGGVPYKFESRDDFMKALDDLSGFSDGRLQ